MMQHKAHIGLINAHAKGNRSHNDLYIIADEGFLVAMPLFVGQTGMVRPR
ncbi:hypothetical protein SDC9_139275 [bioreactor metagenome]|uniref:Uncharacterized protein n=1 Tax=bioreactor metagenome TaxID=1076179 RepID=A0A645DRN6_9ZZZZ